MRSFGIRRRAASLPSTRQPMFRPARESARAEPSAVFFTRAPGILLQRSPLDDAVIQRQGGEGATAGEEEKKDPVTEGLKTTGKQLLKNPRFKSWYEPHLELLKDTLWKDQPVEVKAALIGFAAVDLGVAGLAFSQSPELRETLSGVNIGKPLGWIPYSPVEGFKYSLPTAGESTYGFSADFTLKPYLSLLRERYPDFPVTGATFGLETAYEKGQGLAVTGGKFGLEFLGGGFKAEGKSFTSLSPYPLPIPGETPGMPPMWLKQSVPGMPAIDTGPGFQVMLKADIIRLIDRFSK